MTFRARLLVTFLVSVLVPMIVLALFIRDEMTKQLTSQYERRVASLITTIEEDLSEEGDEIALSLAALTDALIEDNTFRRGVVDGAPAARRYVLDYAGGAMRLTGLAMLQIQDDDGRIVSSGHFRNEYDRLEPGLPDLLQTALGGQAIVETRAPDAPFFALARVASFDLAGRTFTIVGGKRIEARFLSRLTPGDQLQATMLFPGMTVTAGGNIGDDAITSESTLPFIDRERSDVTTATFRVGHRLDELHALTRSIDRWFLVAIVLATILVMVLVGWLASRISRPIVQLAAKTAHVDLDRLDVEFDDGGSDEIGILSRTLGNMTDRLRKSTQQIRDAERRATLGELARQVNHDIKNGLTPIRNVFRHLGELASGEPASLPAVFNERKATLDSSIGYLENLASNYARMSRSRERRPLDMNELVTQVVNSMRDARAVDVRCHLAIGELLVSGDRIALRRVLENVIVNAVDSLDSTNGSVYVDATVVDDDGRRARITVRDTGAGMTKQELAQAFDDFYTTKENGTGLGLSIVRRLVMDHDGTIRIDSTRGEGSTVTIELPVAHMEKT